jgi:hypothetical protein
MSTLPVKVARPSTVVAAVVKELSISTAAVLTSNPPTNVTSPEAWNPSTASKAPSMLIPVMVSEVDPERSTSPVKVARPCALRPPENVATALLETSPPVKVASPPTVVAASVVSASTSRSAVLMYLKKKRVRSQ